MKRVLITGGTGFFGKSILDYFLRHDCEYEFTILSRRGLETTNFTNYTNYGDDGHQPNYSLNSCNSCNSWFNNGPRQIIGDVRSFDLGSSHFDWIIHAATPARVDVPDEEMRSIIIDGTANAIREAKKCGAEKFMMVSSGGVYGKGMTRPVSEDEEPHPVTAYGIAKLEAEKMAVDSGLHVLLPRCFAFVGKHLDRNAHFAIGNFISDALAGKDIVINGDGTPMRSYLYADDLVEWLFAILERGESGRIYNVGSPEAISICDLANSVVAVLGKCEGRSAKDEEESEGRRAKDEEECEERRAKDEQWMLNSAVGPSSLALRPSPTVRILGKPVPGAANYYVPNVDRAMEELGLRVKIGLREAIVLSSDTVVI